MNSGQDSSVVDRPPSAAGEVVTDAEAIARSVREPEAFATVFDRHAAEILRYVHARLGPDLAEDVVAEVFLVAFGKRGEYDLRRLDARPWLYGIASRQIGKHRRAEGRRQRALARSRYRVTDSGEFEQRSAERLTAERLRPQLSAVLAGLSIEERDLLLLIAWAGLSYDEAAQALEVPIGTVRSRLSRLRAKVRASLGSATVIGLEENHDG